MRTHILLLAILKTATEGKQITNTRLKAYFQNIESLGMKTVFVNLERVVYAQKYDIVFYPFLVYSLNCIVDGKKSTKCDGSNVCVWKQMANKTITQMCGAAGVDKPTTAAVCLMYKDGKLECHCHAENCNGHCKPGTWTTMMPKMSTKMMSDGTKMTMKPTVAEEEPAEETRNDEKKDMKVSSDAVCTMATDKMTTMNDKKTNGNGIVVTNGQNGPSTTSKMVEKKPTSNSPVTKAAVHVVIGVFILITPFFQ